MDSAEAYQLGDALHTQSARISRQEEFHEAMTAQVSQLASQIQDLVSFGQPQTGNATLVPGRSLLGGGSGNQVGGYTSWQPVQSEIISMLM